MSGIKTSTYEIKRRLKERMKLQTKLRSLQRETDAIIRMISDSLLHASGGAKDAFPGEVEAALVWVRQAERNEDEGLGGPGSTRAKLRSAIAERARLNEAGSRTQRNLRIALTRCADELGRQLAGKLADMEKRFESQRELVELWTDESGIDEFATRIATAHELLERDDYRKLASFHEQLSGDWEAEIRRSEQFEQKYQNRAHLVRSLLSACHELGYKEIESPRHEDSSDRGSRVVMTVDTFGRGLVRFSISMDDISVNSEMRSNDNLCFEKMDEVSNLLSSMFDVETSFNPIDGERPRLKRKGEKDLPDSGAAATRSA